MQLNPPKTKLYNFLLILALISSSNIIIAQDYEQVEILVNTSFEYEFESFPWPPPPSGASNGIVDFEFLGVDSGMWINKTVYIPNPGFIGLDSIEQCYNETQNNELFCKRFEIEVVDQLSTGLSQNPNLELDMSVSMNPFIEKTLLSLTVKETDEYKVEIFDINSTMLQTSFQGTLRSGSSEIEINGGDLPKGILFCKISNSKNQFKVVKLIKI